MQAGLRFAEGLFAALPESSFNAALRAGAVDFDTEVEGDSTARLSAGLNFRPTEDTAFKLDYHTTFEADPLLNESRSAALLFGVASYF